MKPLPNPSVFRKPQPGEDYPGAARLSSPVANRTAELTKFDSRCHECARMGHYWAKVPRSKPRRRCHVCAELFDRPSRIYRMRVQVGAYFGRTSAGWPDPNRLIH